MLVPILRSFDGFPDETTLGNVDGSYLGVKLNNPHSSNHRLYDGLSDGTAKGLLPRYTTMILLMDLYLELMMDKVQYST